MRIFRAFGSSPFGDGWRSRRRRRHSKSRLWVLIVYSTNLAQRFSEKGILTNLGWLIGIRIYVVNAIVRKKAHANSPLEEERSSWSTASDSFGIRMSGNEATPEFGVSAAILRMQMWQKAVSVGTRIVGLKRIFCQCLTRNSLKKGLPYDEE